MTTRRTILSFLLLVCVAAAGDAQQTKKHFPTVSNLLRSAPKVTARNTFQPVEQAPQLFGLKAKADDSVLLLRDSIVTVDSYGRPAGKTVYTYNDCGYLISEITDYGTGYYGSYGYFIDYSFDEQGRCTRRSKYNCTLDGTRGQETECVEAFYDWNNFPYREVQYAWSDYGVRFVVLETIYDEWMNPIYIKETGTGNDDYGLTVRLVQQKFSGRAYGGSEGNDNYYAPSSNYLRDRCEYSIVWTREHGDLFVDGYKRSEPYWEGNSLFIAEYTANLYATELPMGSSIKDYWQESNQTEFRLNEDHTRPLQICWRTYDENRKKWGDPYQMSLKLDEQGRLIETREEEDGEAYGIKYCYADDFTRQIELKDLLIEDRDLWGNDFDFELYDDATGNVLTNMFGKLESIQFYFSDGTQELVYCSFVFDEWDSESRYTHGKVHFNLNLFDEEDAEDYSAIQDADMLFSYRSDGKIESLIMPCVDHVYDRCLFSYDSWGMIDNIEYSHGNSTEGPWAEGGNEQDEVDPYSPYGDGWTFDGWWAIYEYVETDENGNILYGQKHKEWMGTRFRYQIDTYKNPVGPLEPVQIGGEGYYSSEAPYINYRWNEEEKKWDVEFWLRNGGYASYKLDDGRIVEDFYIPNDETMDMMLVYRQFFTLDEQNRVIKIENVDYGNHQGWIGFPEEGTTSFSYLENKNWLLKQSNDNGYVTTYYYSNHNYVDPDILSVDEMNFSETEDDVWYTLQGQRLEQSPREAGVYIKGRRKVVVKQ